MATTIKFKREITTYEFHNIPTFATLSKFTLLDMWDSSCRSVMAWRTGEMLEITLIRFFDEKPWWHQHSPQALGNAVLQVISHLDMNVLLSKANLKKFENCWALDWLLQIPADVSGAHVLKELRYAYWNVWRLANSNLGSIDNTVVLLSDNDADVSVSRIKLALENEGYHVYHFPRPERFGELNTQDLIEYILAASFLVVVDTGSSDNPCNFPRHGVYVPTCILHAKRKGTGWEYDDDIRIPHRQDFYFTPRTLDVTVNDAIKWADNRLNQMVG
ncbi:MAG: hypothetical protein ACOX44_16870 [Limnochordia bacterium]